MLGDFARRTEVVIDIFSSSKLPKATCFAIFHIRPLQTLVVIDSGEFGAFTGELLIASTDLMIRKVTSTIVMWLSCGVGRGIESSREIV
jgi:hypothetical protein